MSWDRFKKFLLCERELGFSLDISKMNFPDSFLESMEERMERAFRDMEALESGAIANPDENRMVGHYWLRNPALAPSAEIGRAIESALEKILRFSGCETDAGRPPSDGRPVAWANIWRPKPELPSAHAAAPRS